MLENGLIRKLRLMAQLGKQTITIHIFPNISRSKGNQTMKFGRLIEYKVKNIFLQKLCKKISQRD